MKMWIKAFLISLLVVQGQCVQEMQADGETIVKISASGNLIQCSAAIDVLVLLDGSYSIGKGSFERSKHFASKLVEVLDINPDRVRLGVVQFSAKAKLEFGLSDYSTREEAKEAIRNIYFRGGSTEAGKAVHYILRKGFPGGRPGSPKILLLLTDGRSQDNLRSSASLARKSGIKVFVVGVKYPNWPVLEAVASEPSELYVFSAELYDDAVNGLVTTLTHTAVCSDIHPRCRVESRVCFRTTVKSLREYHGNHMCWRRKGQSSHARPMASICPYYGWKRISNTIQSRCHRTLCPDPCDSSPCLNGGTCITESVEEFSCLCPLGYRADQHCGGGKYLIPAGLLECSVDLLFLIDGSWSSGLKDFQQAKDFIRRFTLSSSSSSSQILLAVAQYADSIVMEIPAGRHGSTGDFLDALEAVPFRGGVTRTGSALVHIAENSFRVEGGFRSEVPHIVVLLTGAKAKDQVSPAVERARQREVFVLAMGPSRMQAELTQMTSDPEVVFTYANAKEAHGKVLELRTKVCGLTSPGCYSKSLDLVFMLDSSATISRSDFRLAKAFVRSAISNFDLDADLTQVAIVIYGTKPRTVFGLSTFDSEAGMKKAISVAPYLGGRPLMAKALYYVMEHTLSISQGARPGVHKVIVLVTGGQSRVVNDDDDDEATVAEELREGRITLLVIGPGSSQSQALLGIAGSARMMVVPSYEQMKLYVNNLVQRICRDVRAPVSLCVPNPCLNGGECVRTHHSYSCHCQSWGGAHCEERLGLQDPWLP